MKIGVLGGSFDPPHSGHLHVARTLIKNNYCQKIILMPCFSHPFNKPLTRAIHRLEMTKLLTSYTVIPAKAGIQQSTRFPIRSGMTKMRTISRLSEGKEINVSDLEIKKGETSYTIDTLNALKEKCPKDEFAWIIGEDQIDNFTKWKAWREILEKFRLIVVPRCAKSSPPRSPSVTSGVAAGLPRGGHANIIGNELASHLKGAALAYFKPIDISSSEIRKRIKEGLSIDNLVPKKVERYIIQHKLYL